MPFAARNSNHLSGIKMSIIQERWQCKRSDL
jgi:hypothetical protein